MRNKAFIEIFRIILFIPALLFISIGCADDSDDGRIDKIPTVSKVEPLMGPKTTVVTITGTDFSSKPEENVITFNGKPATVIVSATTTVLKVQVPAASGDGPVIVTVRGKEALQKAEFKYQWSKEIFAGSNAGYSNGPRLDARFNLPEALAIDGQGNLYVCDNKIAIRKIDKAGEVSLVAGGSSGVDDGVGAAAKFNELNAITIDEDGNLYVVDYARLRKITSAGVVSSFAGSTYGYEDGTGPNAKFTRARGIVASKDNHIYVADIGNHVIRKITPNGAVSTVVGSTSGFKDGKGDDAQFDFPSRMTVDADGNLYVFDSNNVRVRKITIDGTVTTLIGDGTYGNLDGPVADAKIADGIQGMAYGKDMSLYWTESYNDEAGYRYMVRKLSPSGYVNTIIANEQFEYFGIVVDDAGVIYVTSDYKILKID